MSGLYLLAGRRVEGPFDLVEVRQRFFAGEWPARTMSWCPGEKRWQSLGLRWSHGGIVGKLVGLCSALLVFVLAAGLIELPGRLFVHLPDNLQTKVFLQLVPAIGIPASVILTGALVITRWKRAHCLPLHYALCVMLTLMAGAASIALCKQTSTLVDAENRFPNASISYDAGARAIHINGTIGRRFSNDVADALSRHADARVVIINSPGGLLTEAFKTGDMLANSRIPLRVEGVCASACGLMWAAVPMREMTVNSRIGLHQNRMVTDVPVEISAAVSRKLETKSTEVLSAAGFTPYMLRQRELTPPASVYWVTSVDIMMAGISVRVLDAQEQPISLSAAKWTVITAAWGQHSLTSQIYQAIAEREPSLAKSYGDSLYWALRANNLQMFYAEDRDLKTLAIRQAFTKVADQAVMDWAQSRQGDLAEASQSANIAECGLLSNTKDAQLADSATRKRINEHTLTRTLALLNAVPVATVGPVLPIDIHGAASDFGVYSSRIVGQLRQRGYPVDVARWDSLQRCGYSNAFLQGAEQMPLTRGAMLVRYGEVGRYTR
jgi:ATP-dependent protease ClpP protease subunit